MNTNSILAEVTRGDIVESIHRGSFAVVDVNGHLLDYTGDIARPIYPRSAIKALQALPLIESGAADAYGFTQREIAIACASHNGEAAHVNAVRSMLKKAGISEEHLECGFHWPTHASAARALVVENQTPTNIHNNCSGKHAAMLATANHFGEALENYVDISHPVQQRIQSVISQFCQYEVSAAPCGIDGCSVPTWAIPLEKLAYGFARLSKKTRRNWHWGEASLTIFDAVRNAPHMVAGTDRFCTRIMRAVPRLFAKTGAEGVFCGAVPHAGVGIAVKCDDGATRAAEVIFARVAADLSNWTNEEQLKLTSFSQATLKNRNEISVGEIRACF